jgi:hypothetical protein
MDGESGRIEPRTDTQEKAMLTILIAAGEKAIEAFHASANPIDDDFLMDLERVVERSRKELVALAQKSSTPS